MVKNNFSTLQAFGEQIPQLLLIFFFILIGKNINSSEDIRTNTMNLINSQPHLFFGFLILIYFVFFLSLYKHNKNNFYFEWLKKNWLSLIFEIMSLAILGWLFIFIFFIPDARTFFDNSINIILLIGIFIIYSWLKFMEKDIKDNSKPISFLEFKKRMQTPIYMFILIFLPMVFLSLINIFFYLEKMWVVVAFLQSFSFIAGFFDKVNKRKFISIISFNLFYLFLLFGIIYFLELVNTLVFSFIFTIIFILIIHLILYYLGGLFHNKIKKTNYYKILLKGHGKNLWGKN